MLPVSSPRAMFKVSVTGPAAAPAESLVTPTTKGAVAVALRLAPSHTSCGSAICSGSLPVKKPSQWKLCASMSMVTRTASAPPPPSWRVGAVSPRGNTVPS